MTLPDISDRVSDEVDTNERSRLSEARLWLSRSVTPLGWFVGAFTLISLLLTITMGLVEYAATATFGLIIVCVAIPYLIGRTHGHVRLALEHDRVTVNAGASIQVAVKNQANRPMLPSRVEVTVDDEVVTLNVPMIAAQSATQVHTEIETPHRAIIRVGPATSVRQDPLGMFRRARTDDTKITLFVHPQTVSVPSSSIGLIRDLDGNPTSKIVDSDIAFHAIRPYAAGDARRHIHWKSTAKTGALMVKQFDETRRSRVAMLLATHETEFANAEEFELAISVVASLGQQSIADGRETEVLTSPTRHESSDLRDRRVRALNTLTPRALLDALAGLGQREGVTTIDHLGARAAQTRRNASLVIIVTGSTVSYRQLRLATLPFGPDVRVVAMTCDPAAQPGVQTAGDLTIVKIGILNDLQQMLLRGAIS